MSRALPFFAVLFLGIGVAVLWFGFQYSQTTPTVHVGPVTKSIGPPPPGSEKPWLEEFELTERSERKIGTKDLRGKVHLVSFFFATCPGTCRQQNNHFGDLEREFGKQGVKFVAISCDPETDDPAKLRDYAQLFNAPKDSWYFLTGDLAYTKRVAAEIYSTALDRKTHVERFLLIDKSGKQRGAYPWADSKKMLELKSDIRKLLDEPESMETDAKKDEASPDVKEAEQGTHLVRTNMPANTANRSTASDVGVHGVHTVQNFSNKGLVRRNMNALKKIYYRGGIASFDIPDMWKEEYEPAGGATFYDDREDSGTLRLNVVSFSSNEKETGDQMITNLVGKNGYKMMNNGLASKHHVKSVEEDGEALLIYYWEVAVPVEGGNVRLALFSYTILASQAKDDQIRQEIEFLGRSIQSGEFSRELGEPGD